MHSDELTNIALHPSSWSFSNLIYHTRIIQDDTGARDTGISENGLDKNDEHVAEQK